MSDTEVPADEPRRGRGRLPGFVMSQEHRDKIAKSNILNALIEHVVSGKEMSSTQVTAGLGLLKKVLPDLQSIEGSMDIHHHKHEDALKELE